MMFAAVDRPRLRRRGPHHRLHEQGVRGARASRRRRGPAGAADARAPNRRRATFRGVLGVAAPARPRRARATRRSPRFPTLRRRRRGAFTSTTQVVARSRGSSSKTTRTWSSTHCSPECAPASTPNNSVGRSRTRPRCGSRVSTSRTTTATGTPSTTRSRVRTRCTTRCNAIRRPNCCAAACMQRCACISIASSTFPRHASRARRRATSTRSRNASRCRAGSTTRATRPTGSCTPVAREPSVIAALGHALLVEDAGFHWFQTVEAGVRQAHQWPEDSEESALILTGVARFLAAHTPTRRELPPVVRIATRLRRGDVLYEDDGARGHRPSTDRSLDGGQAAGRSIRRSRTSVRDRTHSAAADVDGVGLVDEVGAALTVARERDEQRS